MYNMFVWIFMHVCFSIMLPIIKDHLKTQQPVNLQRKQKAKPKTNSEFAFFTFDLAPHFDVLHIPWLENHNK